MSTHEEITVGLTDIDRL